MAKAKGGKAAWWMERRHCKRCDRVTAHRCFTDLTGAKARCCVCVMTHSTKRFYPQGLTGKGVLP